VLLVLLPRPGPPPAQTALLEPFRIPLQIIPASIAQPAFSRESLENTLLP